MRCLKPSINPPDLIISDFRMPGLDGRQLFEKLRGRENTRNIPFVFVASRGDIEEKLRPAVGGGVEDFIPKPFFMADLVRQTKKDRRSPASGKIAETCVASRRHSRASRGNERYRADAVARNGPEILPAHAAPWRGTSRTVFHGGPMQACADWASPKATRSSIKSSVGPTANLKSSLARAPTAKPPRISTTGLLMEAMRLMDEANQSV